MHDLLIPGLIAASLLTAVGTAGWLRQRRARLLLQRRQLDSLRLVRLLKNLMGQLQVHRGLVSVLLNGDTTKGDELSARQDDIAHCLRQLRRHNDPALLTPARMIRIREYWGDIGANFDGWSAEQSFERHSALIRQILFLIADTAEHGRLHELPGMDAASSSLWTDLPATAEAIGQARAVGAGVAAAGHCGSVSRIKLRYLHQRLEAALQGLANLPGVAAACPPKVQQLLSDLEHHLLQPPAPTVSAARYFSVASEALDAVYAVFEQAAGSLERRLAGHTG